ncbi:MAG: hypothetical protein RL119_77, partial [Actinomycetota bacterium]
ADAPAEHEALRGAADRVAAGEERVIEGDARRDRRLRDDVRRELCGGEDVAAGRGRRGAGVALHVGDRRHRGDRGRGRVEDRRARLVARPRLELVRLHRVHADAHVGVRRAAVLGAEAVPCRRRERVARREPEVVGLVGDEVALPPHLRDPEGVEHILGGELELHRTAHRDVELVGGDDAELRVAELPPPLMPDHLHLEGARGGIGLRLEDRLDRRDRDQHQDDRGDHRPGDLEGGVPMDRARLRPPRPLAVLEDRVHQPHFDDDEDDRAPEEEPLEERVDRGVEVGVVVEGGVRILRESTPGERQQGQGAERGRGCVAQRQLRHRLDEAGGNATA